MELEPMDDFEDELREAFERRPAPPSLKGKLLERRRREHARNRAVVWQRLAASLVVAAVLGGGFAWHEHAERRKGEAARQQVLTALRITGHALDQMKTQLAAHDRDAEE